jgi:hypothetical protein
MIKSICNVWRACSLPPVNAFDAMDMHRPHSDCIVQLTFWCGHASKLQHIRMSRISEGQRLQCASI